MHLHQVLDVLVQVPGGDLRVARQHGLDSGYIIIIISVIYIYTHLYISYLLVIDHNNLMNNGLAGQQPTPETTRNCRIRIVAVRELNNHEA